MKITKFLAMMLMAFTVGALCSCGSDDDDDGTGGGGSGSGKAPTSIRGHKFNFFYEYGGELYRSVSFFQNEDGTFGFLSYSAVDSYGAKLEECTKTSANTMHIEILSTHLNGDIGDYWDDSYYQDFDHSYTFDLTFTDDDQGIAYVTETKYALDAWGKWGKQTTEATWYFRMDSDVKPSSPLIDAAISGEEGGDEPWEDNDEDGNDSETVQPNDDGLNFKISSVGKTYLNYRTESGVSGICCGTSPRPTIYDITGRANPSTSTYINLEGLSQNTKYYIRTFKEENGKITYGNKVTSITTVGSTPNSEIMLNLEWVSGGLQAEYAINSTKTFLTYFGTSYSENAGHDFGYETQGGSGEYFLKFDGPWSGSLMFYLAAMDIETDIIYEERVTNKK